MINEAAAHRIEQHAAFSEIVVPCFLQFAPGVVLVELALQLSIAASNARDSGRPMAGSIAALNRWSR